MESGGFVGTRSPDAAIRLQAAEDLAAAHGWSGVFNADGFAGDGDRGLGRGALLGDERRGCDERCNNSDAMK